MLIDSHCHLNMLDLSDFDQQLDSVIQQAAANDVSKFLSVCVELPDFSDLCTIADKYPQVLISLGLHPNNEVDEEPQQDLLIEMANSHPSCIAIGETGLDYYRVDGEDARLKQQDRFRQHICAALATKKPLIIHTRQAAEDTLRIMQEENADRIGGVMHCFAEDLNVAQRAIELNFYISLSGIITFKNATALQDVAKRLPLDRLLIETDSPYLAPVPFRGKQNHPALVKYVALALSELKQLEYKQIAQCTTENFYRCFRLC